MNTPLTSKMRRNDYEENSVMSQVHRPFTGGMAAKVVNKKKSLHKVVLKLKQSTKSIEIFEDEEEDQSIPMVLIFLSRLCAEFIVN
uniref:Uncharacterized protein n=1 Tax=Helianthus annuus TaxID=4232 RepID=A0A251SN70_HELAN